MRNEILRERFLKMIKDRSPESTEEFFKWTSEEEYTSGGGVETDGNGRVFIDDDLLEIVELAGFKYSWREEYFEINGRKFKTTKVRRRISNFENVEEYICFHEGEEHASMFESFLANGISQVFKETIEAENPQKTEDFFLLMGEQTNCKVKTDGNGNIFLNYELFVFLEYIDFEFSCKKNIFEFEHSTFDSVAGKQFIEGNYKFTVREINGEACISFHDPELF